MEDTCPQCGNDLKLVPSGVSKKTGKPYHSFYSCAARCGYTQPTKSEEQKGFRPAVSKDDIPIIREDTPTIKSEIIGVLEDVLEYLKNK